MAMPAGSDGTPAAPAFNACRRRDEEEYHLTIRALYFRQSNAAHDDRHAFPPLEPGLRRVVLGEPG